jgi:rare lipoprotein A
MAAKPLPPSDTAARAPIPRGVPRTLRPVSGRIGIAALFLLAACSSDPRGFRDPANPLVVPPGMYDPPGQRAPTVPRQSFNRPVVDAVGLASWYGSRYHGRLTASGERFDMNAPTAAHRTLPFGSRVRVTNLANGRSVTVRINDRGPFVAQRIIDVSRSVARQLGFIQAGVARVRLHLVQRGG